MNTISEMKEILPVMKLWSYNKIMIMLLRIPVLINDLFLMYFENFIYIFNYNYKFIINY